MKQLLYDLKIYEEVTSCIQIKKNKQQYMIFRLGFFFPWDLNEEAKIDYT